MRRFRLWGSVTVAGIIVLAALLTPWLPVPSPVVMDVMHRFSGPAPRHLLGQDEYGRDVFSRLLWGARSSLGIAGVATALSCIAGTLLGLLAGFLRGPAEALILRAMDVILCLPQLLLALLVVTVLGSGAPTLIPVLAAVYLPGFVRVTYAGTLTVREQEFVHAVRALGAGAIRIMARTILPNIAGPILIQFSLTTAASIMLESGLSFIGLGVLPPASSWGQMIGTARPAMNAAPMLMIWPCLALTITIFAINGICDGLRDVLDPHSRAAARFSGVRRPALPTPAAPDGAVLAIDGLTLQIGAGPDAIRPVRDVSLRIAPGETLALVGESGSGKSLTGLAIAGLLPAAVLPVAGSVRLGDEDVLGLPERRMRRLRGATVAMVFQDPLGSLNPLQTVGRQVADAARAHGLTRGAAWRRAIEMFARVGIPDPARRVRSWPHELSGGMRQRAMIAMGTINAPRLLIADEPTSALDVTVQAQVLDVLRDIRRTDRMAMLFITHSLPVVREIADRVAVMYAGEIMEQSDAASLLDRPLHPYTRALLESVPTASAGLPVGIPGLVPPPAALPPGCLFAPRCTWRIADCETARPALVEVMPARATRCIRWSVLA